ncbi:hypothetical protein HDU76_003243 [Blyttiomyces sp. JEL0837]|nr:hypothetical protein HDU76_003243 [Blyttiomyces sp. JEL0837]
MLGNVDNDTSKVNNVATAGDAININSNNSNGNIKAIDAAADPQLLPPSTTPISADRPSSTFISKPNSNPDYPQVPINQNKPASTTSAALSSKMVGVPEPAQPQLNSAPVDLAATVIESTHHSDVNSNYNINSTNNNVSSSNNNFDIHTATKEYLSNQPQPTWQQQSTSKHPIDNDVGYTPWTDIIRAKYPNYTSTGNPKATITVRSFIKEYNLPDKRSGFRNVQNIPKRLHEAFVKYMEERIDCGSPKKEGIVTRITKPPPKQPKRPSVIDQLSPQSAFGHDNNVNESDYLGYNKQRSARAAGKLHDTPAMAIAINTPPQSDLDNDRDSVNDGRDDDNDEDQEHVVWTKIIRNKYQNLTSNDHVVGTKNARLVRKAVLDFLNLHSLPDVRSSCNGRLIPVKLQGEFLAWMEAHFVYVDKYFGKKGLGRRFTVPIPRSDFVEGMNGDVEMEGTEEVVEYPVEESVGGAVGRPKRKERESDTVFLKAKDVDAARSKGKQRFFGSGSLEKTYTGVSSSSSLMMSKDGSDSGSMEMLLDGDRDIDVVGHGHDDANSGPTVLANIGGVDVPVGGFLKGSRVRDIISRTRRDNREGRIDTALNVGEVLKLMDVLETMEGVVEWVLFQGEVDGQGGTF